MFALSAHNTAQSLQKWKKHNLSHNSKHRGLFEGGIVFSDHGRRCLGLALLWFLFPGFPLCLDMIRFTSMSKWAISFIHCSGLDSNSIGRIKASESQQGVKREKGNAVFSLYSASVLVFIGVLNTDINVVDLTHSIFLSV